MTRPPIELYPHHPPTLLPLLALHLPHSLPLFGTINTNSWSRPQKAIPPAISLPTHRALIDEDQLTSVVWATFPPGTSAPEVWAAIVHLPAPQRGQTSHYCSMQSSLLSLPVDRSVAHPSKLESASTFAITGTSAEQGGKAIRAKEGDDRYRIWRQAQDVMNALVLIIRECSPGVRLFGAMNALWTEECIKVLGSSANGTYNIWIAPLQALGGGETVQEGLEVGTASEEDCVLVQQTRDIPEIIDYYLSRKDKITVLRRSTSITGAPGEAVAWMMTHAGGDLGALYTKPEYRRRGLARWVAAERLRGMGMSNDRLGNGGDAAEGGKSDEGDGFRGYVYVGEDNIGSRRLWETMGWERGWDVKWVHAR